MCHGGKFEVRIRKIDEQQQQQQRKVIEIRNANEIFARQTVDV